MPPLFRALGTGYRDSWAQGRAARGPVRAGSASQIQAHLAVPRAGLHLQTIPPLNTLLQSRKRDRGWAAGVHACVLEGRSALELMGGTQAGGPAGVLGSEGASCWPSPGQLGAKGCQRKWPAEIFLFISFAEFEGHSVLPHQALGAAHAGGPEGSTLGGGWEG